MEVQLQGGVLAFPGQAAAQLTSGGQYGVLVEVEPVPILDVELSYQGAAYRTDDALPGTQSTVLENGGHALLKASPHIGIFEPYAFGGYGLSWVDVRDEAAAAGVVEDDLLQKIPVGVGVDFHVPMGRAANTSMLLGARGTYAFVFDNEAYVGVPNSGDNGDRSSDQLGVSLNIGAQF